MVRQRTQKIMLVHPPFILRQPIPDEPLLNTPFNAMRQPWPDDGAAPFALPSGRYLPLPLEPDAEQPDDGISLIPKPDGEVTRILRGGYNLMQNLEWKRDIYYNVQVR